MFKDYLTGHLSTVGEDGKVDVTDGVMLLGTSSGEDCLLLFQDLFLQTTHN